MTTREEIAQARARLRNREGMSMQEYDMAMNRLDAALGEALEACEWYDLRCNTDRIEVAILRALNGEEKE